MEKYKIEPAKCGCPRWEIKESAAQPARQMFGGHVEGCKLEKATAKKDAEPAAPSSSSMSTRRTSKKT